MIDAQEAYRIGLVNKVVPAADLLAESEKMMRGILAMGPLAVRLAMEAVDQGLEMTLDEGLLLEANHFGLLAATQDMKEGTTAFLEKARRKIPGAIAPLALLFAAACLGERERPAPADLVHDR